MGIVNTWFDSYAIEYLSQDSSREAVISCYQGTKTVARIEFVKNGEPLPPNFGQYQNSYLYYRLSRFQNIVSLLREEKPLQIIVNTNTGVGSISTASQEPTGEEEGK